MSRSSFLSWQILFCTVKSPSNIAGRGKRAAELIQPGETVLLDGGTTTLEVARNLAGKSLQVVTNSLPIVTILAGAPEIELIFLGGYVYPKTGVTLGPLTTAALDRMKADARRRV